VSGKYEYTTKDLKSGKIETIIVEPGDLVITQPDIAHKMKFLEDSVFLTLTTGSRETEKFNEHTVKFGLE
jgi:quercetin dioxygenase-like cupin family protein